MLREVALEAVHAHDRRPPAEVLTQHAGGERIADARRSLVDGVEGGGDNDDVRLRHKSASPGMLRSTEPHDGYARF